MGDMADLARENDFDRWLEEEQYEEDVKKGRWKTKDGKYISISEMTTQHIVNCLNIIEKSNYRWRPEYYLQFIDELDRRR